jgi:hypothetical protein
MKYNTSTSKVVKNRVYDCMLLVGREMEEERKDTEYYKELECVQYCSVKYVRKNEPHVLIA